MSKILNNSIECNNCKTISQQTVWYSINTSVENAAEKILNDEINFFVCPNCNFKHHIPVGLLFNNMSKQYAVYYNPITFEVINKESIGIKKMFGDSFYLGNPIKFNDWEQFKNEIRKLELRPILDPASAVDTMSANMQKVLQPETGMSKSQKRVWTIVLVLGWLFINAIFQANAGPGGKNPGGFGIFLALVLIVSLLAIWSKPKNNK